MSNENVEVKATGFGKVKSWIKRHKVLTVVLVLIFIIIISSGNSKKDVANQSSVKENTAVTTETPKADAQAPATQTAPTPQPTGKTYQKVFSFSGTAAKVSEPFTISGDHFKVQYDCKGDMCQSFIFKTDSKIPQLIMNKAGSTKDETVIYGSGEYYINANVIGSFSMTVLDFK